MRVYFMCDVDEAAGVEMGCKLGALIMEVGLGREDWLLGGVSARERREVSIPTTESWIAIWYSGVLR